MTLPIATSTIERAATSKPATASNPWTRALTVYVILALAVFAFPGGMVAWLDERNGGGWLEAPLALARAVDAVSAATGVKQLGEGLRKRFALWAGEEEE